MLFLKCNERIKTYKFPIFKIVLSVIIVALLIFRGHIFSLEIDNTFLNITERVGCALLGMYFILCICVSCAEILLLHERRQKENINVENATQRAKTYEIEQVLSLLESNDIIEIIILSNKKAIELGASSDSINGKSALFDKKYYIGNEKDVTLPSIRKKLACDYSVDGKISVLSIDGVSPSFYKIRD